MSARAIHLRRKLHGVALLRAFYWAFIRRWGSELCHTCGRPVRLVWWCHDDKLWTAVTGKTKPAGRESAGGIRCIHCFDAAAKKAGVPWIEWAPLNLRYLHIQPKGTQ
jgi:hypothetical protein